MFCTFLCSLPHLCSTVHCLSCGLHTQTPAHFPPSRCLLCSACPASCACARPLVDYFGTICIFNEPSTMSRELALTHSPSLSLPLPFPPALLVSVSISLSGSLACCISFLGLADVATHVLHKFCNVPSPLPPSLSSSVCPSPCLALHVSKLFRRQ